MNIVPATLKDCDLLGTLNQQLIQDEGHRNPMTVNELAERMRAWFDSEYQGCIFLIESDVAGYTVFRSEPDFVYVRQFFVCPEFRRRGVGTNAFAWLAENVWGGSRVRIDVLTDNARAIAFWTSLGFTNYCLTMERD